jgi:hypothetical protein
VRDDQEADSHKSESYHMSKSKSGNLSSEADPNESQPEENEPTEKPKDENKENPEKNVSE